jgi:dinuclear metal center YbgI/SA1388 family protein
VARREEIVRFADELLEVHRFPEFGPPGLQVVGADEVTKIACGVSCSLELFERAAAGGTQLLLVHHGLFWRNEPLVVDRRQRGRLEALFRADVTLVAYHLALDAHPEVGNNARLAAAIGVEREADFGDVGLGGRMREPCGLGELTERIAKVVDRELLVFGEGPDVVQRVAISTGAAGHDLIAAGQDGYDLFLTGEPEEPSLQTARELGIHFVAAGHHATERLGVQALAGRLAEEFGLDWEFIEVENPV